MRNFKFLRKSERKSVGTTLALTVGSPSAHRRYSALKHLTFVLLFLLGSLNVWGETITLTESDVRTNTSYNTSEKTFTNGVQFGYINVMTNNSNGTPTNWAKNQVMQSKNSSYLYNKEALSTIQHVKVYIVVNDNALSVGYGTTEKPTTNTIAKASATQGSQSITYTKYASKTTTPGQTTTATTYDFDLSSFNATYFTIIPGGSTYIWKVEVTYETSGGGSTPSVSIDPEELNFATVGVGDDAPAAKTFTITGSNMTAALSIAALTNFDYSVTPGSLSPSEGSISATVTVTPKSGFTTSAGDKSETLTISGVDLDDDIELALNAEVKAKHNIIFDTDLKSIENVSVMEGETYNITETIEAASIASCTYTKFEGWTTATSIAEASVKPSLVSSVTMSTTDVTLKPVFSKTIGGGGSSEVTITPSGISGTGDPYTITHDQTAYTIQANKNNGSTAPTWNGTAEDIRVYAKGTVVISNSSAMSRIVFNLSTQGLKRLAPISASVGTIATQASGDETVVWTGNATSVTFTVGDKADYGSDGSSKAGQLCFSTITATTGGGGTTTYSLDPGCAAPGQCYAPTFTPEAGTFDAAQNVELTCATEEATIRYTIDGSAPSKTVGTVYSSAIAVSANTTIKAIAYKDGMEDSEIAEGVFNIRYAQPTFSLDGGEYNEAKNVTISAAEADAIYYTTNGEDPTVDPANLYDGSAIAINTTGSHTIKAIAVKAGYANSNVASATYVMDLPYANIAAFIAGEPTTAKSLTLNNAIITGVDGTTLYIQDETAGIMIYGLASLPENAAPNHSISGTIVGKYSSYKNQHELVKPNNTTPIDISDVTISADEVARPAINEYTSLSAAYDAKPMMLVKLTDVSYDGTQYEFSGNKIYNTFGALTDKTMPETTVDCDITGVVINYNGTLELLPVFATDIVADADAADPTVNPAGGVDAENAVTAAAVEITAAADTKVDGLASKTVDINSTTPGEVTVTVTRDFYRSVNYSCGWYKAAAAKYDINGQGATTEGEVVAKVAGVEAATAAAGDEVHVFITPEAHFHLATILVNGAAPTEVTAGEEYSFEMPDEAVTIVVTWTEDAKYALTFTAGEGSGDAPAISGNEYYAGESITLPANTFTYDAQHKFTKWLIGGTEYAAGASYTMPAEAMEAVAQWKEIPNFASGDWILVKDDAELSEGSYVIIAASDAAKAMGSYVSGNNCPGKDATKGEMLTYSNQFAIFEIGDYEIDKVTYKTFFDVETEKYLYLNANNNYLKAQIDKDENTAWTITSVDSENGLAVVNSKSYPDRSMRYNGNSTSIFACYGSNNTNQKHIVLYKYEEHKFTLTYNKNIEAEVSGMPEAQRANEENKVTVSTDVPTCGSKIFTGWNTQDDGNGEAKAANAVLTLSDDLTLYAQWRDPVPVTVSYDANEGTGEMAADAGQVEGSTYTIKANAFERNGYLFAGWKAYDANDDELTITNGKFIVPATNVTVKAQWQSATDSKWVLVEHLSQLADGDKVIIAAADYGYALGAASGSVRTNVAVTKTGKLLSVPGSATELILGRNGNDFTFKDGTKYLNWASGNNLTTSDEVNNNSTWNITIENNATTIANKATAERKIKYNAQSPRFAAYTGSQQAVVIYKYLDMDPEDATSGYEREDLVLSGIGTICLPYNVKASDRFGGVFYMPSHKTSGFANFIEETGTLRAGKAYIFVAENEFIRLKYSGAEVSEPLSDVEDTRGLIGTFTNIAPGNLTDKYVIANNKLMQCGSGAYLNAYRAYLDLDAMPAEALVINDGPGAAPRRRLGIGGNAPDVTTGMENVQGDNVQATKVLINGELFILRGEKMYDAKGQLVK